jgi:hypothetical protein
MFKMLKSDLKLLWLEYEMSYPPGSCVKERSLAFGTVLGGAGNRKQWGLAGGRRSLGAFPWVFILSWSLPFTLLCIPATTRLTVSYATCSCGHDFCLNTGLTAMKSHDHALNPYKTGSWNKSFFFLCCSCQMLCHRDQKMTNTKSMFLFKVMKTTLVWWSSRLKILSP